MKSLYEHAGGEEALHRLEELFYSKVLADPVLKRLFTERRPHHVDHLTWFTTESFGPFAPHRRGILVRAVVPGIVTIAWESEDAQARAGAAVAEYDQRIGYDRAATLARRGARTEVGAFRALKIA
jgi:hypothetical protein